MPEDVEQPGAVHLRRLEERLHDLVQVRHGDVVDRERPGQGEMHADPAPPFPEAPEQTEHDEEEGGPARGATE